MKRIAHVTSGLDRHAAGVGVAVSALSAEQQAKGFDVSVFGLASSAWSQGDQYLWRGAPAAAFPVQRPPQSFGYAPELGRALEQFDPDVVHVHGLWMYPALAVLRWHRRTGKPYIYSPHGMLSPVALRYSSWKKRLARHLFQDAALAEAPVLHATTEAEAEEFRAFGLRNQIAVVPLGIQEVPVPAVRTSPTRQVLSLGRLHPQKGLDKLVQAWARLEGRFPGWVLDLVGPDHRGYSDRLQRLAAELNVHRMTISQPVHGADRDARMAAAEIFVLPTLNENFALTVAESLMMCTPVVATRGAPWPGLVAEGCGWWIEQGVEPLARTLEEAMRLTDGERLALGQRGRAWMLRDYAWSSVAQRLLDIYLGSLQPGPASLSLRTECR